MRKIFLMAGVFLALASPAVAAPAKPGVLIDQLGRPVPGAALSGHYLLVYFGYTACPDVCPMTLDVMSDVLDSLGGGRNLKAYFVTVDPLRDTPPVMRQYLTHFSPGITGLTGRPDDIAATAARFNVSVTPGPKNTISHGVFIFFLGPDGRLIKSFHPGAGAAAIAGDIRAALEDEKIRGRSR